MRLECPRVCVFALAFTFAAFPAAGEAAEKPSVKQEGPVAPEADRFVRTNGPRLVLDGKPFRLRAVNFSNFYHTELTGPGLLSSTHHSEQDFAQAKNLGFNAIRFAINGNWHARFADAFWEWLDRNVQWARAQQIYLILDLHTPVDSFWLDPTSPKVNFDLWTSPEVRQRNIAFWRDVAERYRDEPYIAAYDILNEPVTTDSTGKQWQDLAQEIVTEIRSVDQNHLLIVGALYGIEGRYGVGNREKQFLVDDDNVMYDFHFYEPIKYTHQFATWLTGPVKDGGRYPDPQVILPTGKQVLRPASRIRSRPVAAGTTDWTAYDSGIVTISDKGAVAGRPMIVARGALEGAIFFDSLKVTEYDSKGAFLREITDEPLTSDGTLDWYPWESGARKQPSKFERERGTGHDDSASLSITTSGSSDSAVSGWSNDGHLFRIVPGNGYRIAGFMRGEGVTLSAKAQAGFEIDVYGSAPGSPVKGFFPRDKAYLEYEMMKHLQFGIKNKVPMSVMEFGLVRQGFEMEGKGGRQWVVDVLSLLAKYEASFAYWEYHGQPMGLFLRGAAGPGQPNTVLIDTLKKELAER